MFRIVYGYYRRSENFNFTTGSPIIGYVDGKTIKQVDEAFQLVRNNHDVSKYTPIDFRYIREIKEH